MTTKSSKATMKVQKLIEERLRASAARLPVLEANTDASRRKRLPEAQEAEAKPLPLLSLEFDFLTEFRGVVSNSR